jgi:hypothetical protein
VPTVLRHNGYRFFFYSNEHLPIHIHIEKGEKTAKYEIETLALRSSYRFSPSELREIRILVEQNQELFRTKWNEYFNS